jgi:DNA-binding response OmpR family regulator
LPDIDGREAMDILRKNGFKGPIIMLTGHVTKSDIVLVLESGAKDYVTKSFRFTVLLARIRARLRQYEVSEDAIAFAAILQRLNSSRDRRLRTLATACVAHALHDGYTENGRLVLG